jgi:hypothetical protein
LDKLTTRHTGESLAGLLDDEGWRTAPSVAFHLKRPLAGDVVGERRHRDEREENEISM